MIYAPPALPAYSVDSFIDDSKGNSVLTFTCANGKTVTFKMKKEHLGKVNSDDIYVFLIKECGQKP